MNWHRIIRLIYLYGLAAIGVMILTIGAVTIIDVLLRSYVLLPPPVPTPVPTLVAPPGPPPGPVVVERPPGTEEYYRIAENYRRLATAIAQLIIGLPLWAYHWRLAQREARET